MTTQTKKNYTSPCILSVIIAELEEGIATSSTTMTIGGTSNTTPEVTDWQDTNQETTLDL